MSVYRPKYTYKGVKKQSSLWWYKFWFAGKEINEPSKSGRKTVAKEAERQRRMELERGFNDLKDPRQERIRTVRELAAKFLEDYRVRNPDSATFAEYALGHVTRHLGRLMSVDADDTTVTDYQTGRLKEKASAKSINDESVFLLRILGERGDMIRAKLNRKFGRRWKLSKSVPIGQAFTEEDKAALLQEAANRPRSRAILPALVLHLHVGMRAKELRHLQWSRIDLEKAVLQTLKSKTPAGELRRVPLNATALAALVDYSKWYLDRFGETRPEWYVFPFGNPRPTDPTRPQTTFMTVWKEIREKTGIVGRWHDLRHTWKTDLGESPDATDDSVKEMGGWDSDQMLKHYSHARMEQKRKAVASLERPLPKKTPKPGSDSSLRSVRERKAPIVGVEPSHPG